MLHLLVATAFWKGQVVAYEITRFEAVFSSRPENQEVTCYRSNYYASPFSGTRCNLPRLIPLHHEYTSRQQLDEHRALQKALLAETDNSKLHHTIVILRLSSLMRQDDVDGARCRSDAVWATVAEGLVRYSISTDRPQMKDHVVSVLGLIDGTEKVNLDHEPLDFVLYNKMICVRDDWDSFPPQGRAVLKRSMVEFIELFRRRRRGATISISSVTVLLFASDDLSLPDGSVLDQKTADYLQS